MPSKQPDTGISFGFHKTGRAALFTAADTLG